MCKGKAGDGTESLMSSPARAIPRSQWKESQCLSPTSPLSFSKFRVETEWGEMEDYDDIAGGPLCVSPSRSSPSSYEFTSPTSPSQSWFDVRVIYVRVTGSTLEEAPESLTMRFPTRSIGIALEVNGGRISPSEEASLLLRRDRVDTETAEATYVSTNNLRTSGTVVYEVLNKEEAILSGTLEHLECAEGHNWRSSSDWGMDCTCVVGQSGCVFLRGRHDFSSVPGSPPAMEISVVGRYSESPVFLTQTVQLTARRRSIRSATLDAIPETEALGEKHSTLRMVDQQLVTEGDRYMDLGESNPFMDLSDKSAAGLGYALDGSGYGIEGEDGDMTWFNAGVRVGVGIGLGMCLGVGIGVGLIVRTYQATTRPFRRGFI